MIRISQLKLPFDHTEADLKNAIEKTLGLSSQNVEKTAKLNNREQPKLRQLG